MPKLIIFDHDGLMVNSENVVFAALGTIFARYGRTFAWDYYVTSVGLPVVESIAMYLRDLPVPLAVEAFTAERDALVAEYFATRLELMPGLVPLLDWLRARRVPMAVATSATRAHLSRNLERFGLAHYFQAAVCLDDVRRGKPHPDLILEVLARLGRAPEDAIMLEDAPLGVEAARRAGVFCVAVPTHGIDLARFAGADLIARDLVAVRTLLAAPSATRPHAASRNATARARSLRTPVQRQQNGRKPDEREVQRPHTYPRQAKREEEKDSRDQIPDEPSDHDEHARGDVPRDQPAHAIDAKERADRLQADGERADPL